MGGDCTARGASNANARGNTTDRARRRAWLMVAYASDIPDHVRCYRCGCLLAPEEITVDRILPGKDGGSYRRNNIRPACGPCNIRRKP